MRNNKINLANTAVAALLAVGPLAATAAGPGGAQGQANGKQPSKHW